MSDAKIQSTIRALKTDLRSMKYQGRWIESKISEGDPSIFLMLLHFIVLEFNSKIVEWASQHNYTFLTSTDLEFFQQLNKLLVEKYQYRNKIPVDRFFKPGFAQQKINLCRDIIKLVKVK